MHPVAAYQKPRIDSCSGELEIGCDVNFRSRTDGELVDRRHLSIHPHISLTLWSRMSSFLMRGAAAAPRAVRAFSTTPAHNLARMTIVGHLADAPELSATSTGHSIVRYTIASNFGPKENRQTSWFRVVSFLPEGPRRDFLTNLPKGCVSLLGLGRGKSFFFPGLTAVFGMDRTLVYLEADATMNSYEDAEGKNRSSLNIVQRTIPTPTRHAQVVFADCGRFICRKHRSFEAPPNGGPGRVVERMSL